MAFPQVVHAIGMLLESDLNRFASGSGSVPAAGSTFDEITRQTALNAAAAAADFLTRCVQAASAAHGDIIKHPRSSFAVVPRQPAISFLCRPESGKPPPFVFVSAAEAAWPFEAPLPFLRRYLTGGRAVPPSPTTDPSGLHRLGGARLTLLRRPRHSLGAAKKAVERALLDDYLPSGRLRASVMRPSLVWTPRNPGALPAVGAIQRERLSPRRSRPTGSSCAISSRALAGAFTAANAIGVPFIDR